MSSGVGFFCFHALGDTKTKETYPTRPGSPTPCKQALSRILWYTNHECGKFQRIHVQTAWQYDSQKRPDHVGQWSIAHQHCVTRCPVSRLVHSPGRPASVITWKISAWDLGTTILVSHSKLTGLARLSYNRRVDFCCVELRRRDLCKASQPGSCNQACSQIFRPPLNLTDFSKPRAHTQNFSFLPPPEHLYTLLAILNELLALSMFSP